MDVACTSERSVGEDLMKN